jgi:hypothetical protein
VHDYAQGIHDAIDSIDELLREGRADEVVDLTEHALSVVERALQSVDDSDGYMGGILERLQQLHLAACRKAKPDPIQLARRLWEWELRGEWDLCGGERGVHLDCRTLPRELIDHGEAAESPAIHARIVNEIHAPAFVRLRGVQVHPNSRTF